MFGSKSEGNGVDQARAVGHSQAATPSICASRGSCVVHRPSELLERGRRAINTDNDTRRGVRVVGFNCCHSAICWVCEVAVVVALSGLGESM